MMLLPTSLLVALLSHNALAIPQAVPTTTSSITPTITLSTSVASPTVPLTNTLPSQQPLPPVQAWCPSQIFCAGQLLQTLNLAQVYSDPKTIVDKPTSKSSQQVLSDFNAIPSNTTEGDIVTFVDNDFKGEGLELEATTLDGFTQNPPFLQNVTDSLLQSWTQTVHGYWAQLVRSTNTTALCQGGNGGDACESSLIPLNHTFVVPGGRFREQYYWDSYWILRGLLKSQLFSIANETLQNFMDELEQFGFIPNGGRIYYLNRSQPPLFIQMLDAYISESNDTSILTRALPLAEKELAWWSTNRTITVTSPFTNTTYDMFHYAVNNTAPRPESYLQDYETANDPTIPTNLTVAQQADLFSELASGAESGWDYSSRFAALPNVTGNALLRSYNIKNHVAVDLNSILYRNHMILASFYDQQQNSSFADNHTTTAENLKAGILDLCWDSSKLAFYDFNVTANGRNSMFTAANFYPVWNGIIPTELTSSSDAAFKYFSVVNMVLNRYNGTFPVTFHQSGQQWDAPNAWPPHQHIILEALKALPANVTNGTLPTPASNQSTYDLIPSGQLDVAETDLPDQLIVGSGNATKSGAQADVNTLNGTVYNGGNATQNEGWSTTLQRELANRYFASAFCSWHATGGSIPNILPKLSDQELNVTQSVNNTGNMFEKFSISDIDSAGRGGEYTVQAGFGWTNGVVLLLASEYGQVLVRPTCPDLLAEANTKSGGSSSNDAFSLAAVASDRKTIVAAVAGMMAALAIVL
ncbi:glycoside hydrolase family 37 protein [Cytidiella melzeri]|nr:glycoside hydrolase family 37 protein [Cytidiella melzeri]